MSKLESPSKKLLSSTHELLQGKVAEKLKKKVETVETSTQTDTDKYEAALANTSDLLLRLQCMEEKNRKLEAALKKSEDTRKKELSYLKDVADAVRINEELICRLAMRLGPEEQGGYIIDILKVTLSNGVKPAQPLLFRDQLLTLSKELAGLMEGYVLSSSDILRRIDQKIKLEKAYQDLVNDPPTFSTVMKNLKTFLEGEYEDKRVQKITPIQSEKEIMTRRSSGYNVKLYQANKSIRSTSQKDIYSRSKSMPRTSSFTTNDKQIPPAAKIKEEKVEPRPCAITPQLTSLHSKLNIKYNRSPMTQPLPSPRVLTQMKLSTEPRVSDPDIKTKKETEKRSGLTHKLTKLALGKKSAPQSPQANLSAQRQLTRVVKPQPDSTLRKYTSSYLQKSFN